LVVFGKKKKRKKNGVKKKEKKKKRGIDGATWECPCRSKH